MILSPINKTITVVGGTGTVTFPADFPGRNFSVTAPVNSPMYNIDGYSQAGNLIFTAKNIGIKYALVECYYSLKKTVTITISAAADDGAYLVELHSNSI